MLRFSLQRPTELDAALAAYGDATGDAAYIAGGTELLQVMKMGLAEFTTLIDLKGISELSGIAMEGGTLRIGATTTHRDIERSPVVATAAPALAALEGGVANVRVRNCGTLGGNIAFAEPHSDPATLLLVCDARVELAGNEGRREVPIADFTIGPLFTVREPDEVLVSIRIPAAQPDQGTSYAKVKFFERPAVSVAVRVRVADGAIESCSVAVGSLTDVPMLVPESAAALVGAPASEDGLAEVIDAAVAPLHRLDAVEDHNGSADYKRHLASVLFARVSRDAMQQAGQHA